ncbi:MAG TPA: hypothetical protein DCR46_08440 [Cytophagales bacterium]|nr:hypothetical protein [Cytophagales bacterium]
MLNAKYAIISPDQPPQLMPGALGNAWFVREIKKVQNPDDEIAALDNFEPAYTAVVDVSKFKIGSDKFDSSTASITLKTCTPKYLQYVSKSSSEKLAVFSEIYYPIGWTATIDGKPADLIRANYVLRAMYIPAGTHTIEMKFDMPSYHLGEKISLVCSILLFSALLGITVLEILPKKKSVSH